jgi:ParB-like chromosome segregation protein Spo0J
MTVRMGYQDETGTSGTAPATGELSLQSAIYHPHFGISCRYEEVDPRILVKSEYNLRRRARDEEEDFEGAVRTKRLIKEIGILHPPVVTPSNKVIAGWRRVNKALRAQLPRILIHRLQQEPSRKVGLILSYQENCQRKQLSPNERIDYALHLLEICNGKVREVADLMHVHQKSVYGLLRLAQLRVKYPDITLHLGIEKALALWKILDTQFKKATEEEIQSLVIKAKSISAPDLRNHPDRLMGNDETEGQERLRTVSIPESSYMFLLKGRPRGTPAREWIVEKLKRLQAQKTLV